MEFQFRVMELWWYVIALFMIESLKINYFYWKTKLGFCVIIIILLVCVLIFAQAAKSFLVGVAFCFCAQFRFFFGCYFFVQDMWLYLSEYEKFNDFGSESSLVWHETNIPYAVWGPESTRTLTLKYHPSEV